MFNPYTGWQELRRRRLKDRLTCWGGAFLWWLIILLSQYYFDIFWPALVFVLLWIPLLVVMRVRVWAFICPRCEQEFFSRDGFFKNPWLQKCPHCGLPKWS